MRKKLPTSERIFLDRLVLYGMKMPEGIESLQIHVVIKMLRCGLGMTQAQLAKRAGLFQSYIAEIEQGEVDLKISTVQKIFRALYCDTLIFPKFKKKPESIVAERAKETARRKIARVSGSMALEKQLPDDKLTCELIRIEEQRLKDISSSEIWNE